MTSRLRVITIGTCLAGLLLASVSQAALPTFNTSKLIDINRSFAGVKIGGTLSSAKKAWGKPQYCDVTYCVYRKSRQNNSTGEGSYAQKKGIVFNAQLSAPRDSQGKVHFDRPLTLPKTSKGIGIGSTERQFKKAYPNAKNLGGAYLIKKGNRQTQFNIDPATKRIFTISMADTRLAQS
jgi:hypothetical protein